MGSKSYEGVDTNTIGLNGRRALRSTTALLIREGEGLTIEFKERYSSRIDQDIVAFANTRGGTILLGVSDDGKIAGEKLTNDLKAKINDLARNCKPGISVQASQSGKVVVIEVPEGRVKPCSCSDGYFRRLNGTTQKMGHDEIQIMFRENDPVPFEERTVRGFLSRTSPGPRSWPLPRRRASSSTKLCRLIFFGA